MPPSARVLVVEDDYLVGLDLQHALVQAGYSVRLARDGGQAIAAALAERPDLIIMDINLGGGPDGVEVATRLLGELGVRSIFATAYGDEAMRVRADAAQPLGWLRKPFTATALLAGVRQALDTLGR